MSTVAITRCKNEADIVEWSLRRMCQQVDAIIMGDNSTDGSREIIESLIREGLPITLHEDQAMSYEQADVMTAYAMEALALGHEFSVFFDIDEAWRADTGRIADRLAELPEHILIAPARNLTHCATALDDPDDPDPMSRMGWRSAQMLPLAKVACRLRADLQVGHGNHDASYSDDTPFAAAVNGILESRHFPYRSPEQFIKRVAHSWPQLRDSGLPAGHGAHMRVYGEHLDEFGPEGLTRWFYNGMFFDDPAADPDLVFDPLPPLTEPLEDADAKTWP